MRVHYATGVQCGTRDSEFTGIKVSVSLSTRTGVCLCVCLGGGRMQLCVRVCGCVEKHLSKYAMFAGEH